MQKRNRQANPSANQMSDDGLVASLTNANGFMTSYNPDGSDRLSATTYPEKEL
jgi:YD repeat-containing protein